MPIMPTTNADQMEQVGSPTLRADSIWVWVLVLVVLIASAGLALGFGAASITFDDLLAVACRRLGGDCEVNAVSERILVELRLPRVILAFLAGAGLSLAGAVLQVVTRNPLADPYLFGISSGASFGAVLVIAAVGSSAVAGYGLAEYGITFGAFAGSALSVLIVISLAGAGVQIERMLLSGVAVSFMFGAGTSLVLYFSEPQAAATLLFWTLGSFSGANWDDLLLPSSIIISCLVLFVGYSRPLQTVLAGDENAKALGVDVDRLRIAMLLLSSLVTATLVANCGGIGFVGLMIPHIVRRLMPGQSKYVFIGSALFGGIFMIWVDVLARVLIDGAELPIGVITAAIGSGFFLLVLKKRNWSE